LAQTNRIAGHHSGYIRIDHGGEIDLAGAGAFREQAGNVLHDFVEAN